MGSYADKVGCVPSCPDATSTPTHQTKMEIPKTPTAPVKLSSRMQGFIDRWNDPSRSALLPKELFPPKANSN